MQIVQRNSRPNGSRPPIQTWSGEQPPEGYIEVACPIDVFVDNMGFVDLGIEDGVVVGMTPNSEALDAYLASLPTSPEEPEDPLSDTDRMAAAYLAGVQEA